MASGVRVSVDELPYGPRGPPLVLISRVPGYDAVIAYTIHVDGRPVIVMYAETYAEIRELQARGLLAANYLERLLVFEHDFRVAGSGSEPERLVRAAVLVDELDQARADNRSAVGHALTAAVRWSGRTFTRVDGRGQIAWMRRDWVISSRPRSSASCAWC
ncbi:hypothetical protein BJF90_06295 [Pseudonocardia sp. CNS-004]|nr:hypothetical protein BJF90_06295 [Pseudonocardia sp. CNS-004]